MYMFLNFLDIYMYKICIRKFKIVIKMELDIKRFAIHIKLIIVMNSIPFFLKLGFLSQENQHNGLDWLSPSIITQILSFNNFAFFPTSKTRYFFHYV